jgi:hypothetical protein
MNPVEGSDLADFGVLGLVVAGIVAMVDYQKR